MNTRTAPLAVVPDVQRTTDIPMVATSSAALILDDQSMDRLIRVAELMATGRATIPQHLRNTGDCLAVAMQAVQWRMNPFAVAQKTHVTQGGALGYEAQLINAVVTTLAPIERRPEFEFLGDWGKILGKVEERKSDKGGKYYVAAWDKKDEAGLGVICRCQLRGEAEPREIKVMMSQCYPRFSTQWATDPQQQITYVAIRKWARRYTPDVILGVYAPEELEQINQAERDMGAAEVIDTPEPASRTDALKSKLGAGKQKPATQAPAVTLEQVLNAISAAHDRDTMAAAKELGSRLPDGPDKDAAVAAYGRRLDALRAAAEQAQPTAPATSTVDPETGEVTDAQDDFLKDYDAAEQANQAGE